MLVAPPELSRCMLCGSAGFPGTQCEMCLVPRPQFDDSVVAAKCPRCTTPLEILTVGPGVGTRIFACLSCRGTFLPARAWSLAFADVSVANEVETRVPLPSIRVSDALPIMLCPSCMKPMDRTRFAGMSKSTVDVCRFQHGVWIDAGEIRSVVTYEPSGDQDKPLSHRDRPEIAAGIVSENRRQLANVRAATSGVPNFLVVFLVFVIGCVAIIAGMKVMGGCRGLLTPEDQTEPPAEGR